MKTAIIIGSTGLVGHQLLGLLSYSDRYTTIFSISRTKPDDLPDNVIHIPFNSGDYVVPAPCDAAFCCLGTTMKKAGSKEAFLKVDLEMVSQFAKKVIEAGARRFAVVSSIGANPDSSGFYLKTKGQMEEQLKKNSFERLVIVRPSLLLGKRNEQRFGEDIGKMLFSLFRFVFVGSLRKYRGISAEDVAKAMMVLAEEGVGTTVAESDMLVAIAGKV